MKFRIIAIIATTVFSFCAKAQYADNYGSGLRLNLDDKKDRYIRFMMWDQIWVRSIQNNPATLVNGQASANTMDIGARRVRLMAWAQISPRYLILINMGINNQSFDGGGATGTTGTGSYGAGKKPQIFFQEAYSEYTIIPTIDSFTRLENNFTMFLGGGLHYFNGVSRMSSAASLNLMMVDAPTFNFPNIENSDQSGMQYGLYVKGKWKKLHYQFSLDKPFATSLTPVDSANVAVDHNGDPSPATSGYMDYRFCDQEASQLAYRTGTYLGSKKVFNIGAGFYHEANGTESYDAKGIIRTHDIFQFGADVFLDLPLGAKTKGMALTCYGVYYNFDFGPNYLRTSGTMNPGSTNDAIPAAQRALEGAGNSRILLGTGSIAYIQAGFLLPKFNKSKNKVRMQPIAAYTYKDLQALSTPGSYWDAGCNFFIDAHNAKITLQYSDRPLYNAVSKEIFDHKGEFIIQFQTLL